jgi:hypothetical protein
VRGAGPPLWRGRREPPAAAARRAGQAGTCSGSGRDCSSPCFGHHPASAASGGAGTAVEGAGAAAGGGSLVWRQGARRHRRWLPGCLAGILFIRVCEIGQCSARTGRLKPPPPAYLLLPAAGDPAGPAGGSGLLCRHTVRTQLLPAACCLLERSAGFFLHGWKACLVLNCRPACLQGGAPGGGGAAGPASQGGLLPGPPARYAPAARAVADAHRPAAQQRTGTAGLRWVSWEEGGARGAGSSSSSSSRLQCTPGTPTNQPGGGLQSTSNPC